MIPVDPTRPIVREDRTMEEPFRRFVVQISYLPPMVGTGSPEGVVSGIQTQTYMDDSGTAGSILYIKKFNDVGGDKTQGWILV